MKDVTVEAVIVAAGSSTRMGVPKQFILLDGKPVILHTLTAFERCNVIKSIVVVAREQDRARLWELAKTAGIRKLKEIVCGGNTRQQSVYNGVSVCKADYIAIHDGARPFITPQTIEKVVQAAVEHGAATAAARTKDTIKIADAQGMVVSTPERASLWNVQTPQIFKRDIYERAWENSQQLKLDVTDDCQLIEALSLPVKLVESPYTNMKITTPEDVLFAEGLLKCESDTDMTFTV